MTKGLRLRFLAFVFFLAPSAEADWVTEKEEKFTASTENEIRDLVARFPDHFFERAEDLEFAAAHVRNSLWKGATLCAPGDARLRHEAIETETRLKPKDGEKSSAGASASIMGMSSGDPCAPPPPREGQWVLENESNQEFRSEREIASYLSRHRSRYPEIKPEELEFASEKIKRYRWVGKTSCKLGDPRLSREEDDGEIIFKDPNLSAAMNASNFYGESDPCR